MKMVFLYGYHFCVLLLCPNEKNFRITLVYIHVYVHTCVCTYMYTYIHVNGSYSFPSSPIFTVTSPLSDCQPEFNLYSCCFLFLKRWKKIPSAWVEPQRSMGFGRILIFWHYWLYYKLRINAKSRLTYTDLSNLRKTVYKNVIPVAHAILFEA
jgi:hypothetical protein